MIGDNPIAKQLIIESGEQIIPDLTNSHMREGRRPEVHKFSHLGEREAVYSRPNCGIDL
jgi:hypothetical protein